jgi:hypothetical protein
MTSSSRTSKNRRAPKPKGEPTPIDLEVRNQVVLLLVSGVPVDAAREAAQSQMGLSAAVAAAAVEQAQAAIVLAADVDRRRELGIAYHRLNDLYAKGVEMMEPKVALAAQRELNRLLALADADRIAAEALQSASSESAEGHELAAIADHLLPLKLAPASHPLSEHARIAADHMRRCQAWKPRKSR